MENTLAAKPPTRPQEIDDILNSLDRYNSANIDTLQQYAKQQADGEPADIAANLALLKLYQFNISHAKDEYIVMILAKALVRFYTSDFSAAMHLLPAHVTSSEDSALRDQVDKLFELYQLLDACRYGEFWAKLESHDDKDDSYADLVADVQGFEDDLRLSIAKTVELSCKQISTPVFKEWVNINADAKFQSFVQDELKWSFKNNNVQVPLNKDNDVKPVVTNESLKLEQLNRLIKRAYENEVTV